MQLGMWNERYQPLVLVIRCLIVCQAPKKLIRYIDNQVVSTKGERFKDVRNPETEEMKATYINLKPARKYRFH